MLDMPPARRRKSFGPGFRSEKSAYFPSSLGDNSMTGPTTTSLMGRMSAPKVERLGFPFLLILLYLILEYARPANPMKIPMIISIILFFMWTTLPEKNWSPQIICFSFCWVLLRPWGRLPLIATQCFGDFSQSPFNCCAFPCRSPIFWTRRERCRFSSTY